MSRENTYLEFNNPIHIIWRSGSADDPYIDRLDISKVVNQRVALLEIPDEFYKVRIAELIEINYKRFIKDTLKPNEFYVDYSNGFVYFHASKEAKTLSIVYKGRGMLLYPASRIVTFDGSGATENLQTIMTSIKEQIKVLIDETQNFEEVLKNMVIATNLTKEATDGALNATLEADIAIDKVKDAYRTTVLIYMPFVKKESEIATKYPNPNVGWTVQVSDTGVRFRWDGKNWVPIDILGGNIAKASEFIDGLMSKEHYTKLETVTKSVNTRVIVFVVPQDVLSGIQDPHIAFPFDGTISSISASVAKDGSSDTTVRIQKSVNYVDWDNITSTHVQINARENFDNGNYVLTNKKITKGDIFRLYVPSSGDVQNLTLNIEVEIK